MALISCDECGHRISDKSIFCPNCGYPTHLNKALREQRDNQAETAKPEETANFKSSPLSEMSDKAVEAALKPEQTSTSTQSSSDVTDQSGDHDDKEIEASTAVPNVTDGLNVVTDGLNVDNEDVANSVADALAEYEATLSKPITHERNERNKLILYFAVLLALLLIIGGCYYYAKSNHLQSVDEVECEPIEEVLEEEPTVTNPDDTAAAAINDTVNSPAVTGPQPVGTVQQPASQTSSAVSTSEASTITQQPAAAPQVQQSPAVRQL